MAVYDDSRLDSRVDIKQAVAPGRKATQVDRMTTQPIIENHERKNKHPN
jgi:hypothetical protein